MPPFRTGPRATSLSALPENGLPVGRWQRAARSKAATGRYSGSGLRETGRLAWYVVSLAPEPERRETSRQRRRRHSASGERCRDVVGPLIADWLQTGGRIKRGKAVLRICDAEHRNSVREAEADWEVELAQHS